MALLAIKQNEPAAEAAGINTLAWKMRAITLSGAIAAAAGGFYAVVLLVVTPHSVFGMLVSAQALMVTLFGGVGTVWGPVIGSAILVPLAETLNAELGTASPASRAWCSASPSSRDPARAGGLVLERARSPPQARAAGGGSRAQPDLPTAATPCRAAIAAQAIARHR